MDYLIPLVLLAAVAFLLWKRRGDIKPDEARALVERGALLVDVRTPDEFAAGHIAGARNIPLDQVSARASTLTPADAPVIVYCRSGARSALAKRLLKSAGRPDVRNLGAMNRW
jgi:phage shock protein E